MFTRLREHFTKRKLKKAQEEIDRLRASQIDLYQVAFDRAFDKAFDFAWALQDRKVQELLIKKEKEIVSREDARLDSIMKNHRARVDQADSPQALRLYDELCTRLEHFKLTDNAPEVARTKIQIEVVGRLIDVKKPSYILSPVSNR